MIEYVFFVSILALVFALTKAVYIKHVEVKNKKVRYISGLIHKGAITYLNKQYRVISIFVLVVFIVLLFLDYRISISFLLGAFFSALAGNIGMRVSTLANGKTAEACKEDFNKGLNIAFSSGTVMGMFVTGIGILGVAILYVIFRDPNIIYGFGFGASSIALFARVGGGIYTKAADVGADLVGKVEAGIPEDDPRNPAVIADNVGDNVGDVAGMGADLFESYVDSIIVAMAIGFLLTHSKLLLPLLIASLGIVVSIIGTFFVRTSKGEDASKALNKGMFISAMLMFILSYFLITSLSDIWVWVSSILGLITGVIIGLVTEYYTSYDYRPTQGIAEASKTGAATNIIRGLSTGMISPLIPIILVSVTMILSYKLSGLYGIAVAAVGMLSILPISLATDTYGPVADNAAGIAEMANLGKMTRERTERLDAVGNTTAAVGKGFAIASAALTALALFSAYMQSAGIEIVNLSSPYVIAGLFIGALLPFLFSSFALEAVGKAAYEMVNEVRRQFKEKKGIMKGKVEPDYNKCIETVSYTHLTLPTKA